MKRIFKFLGIVSLLASSLVAAITVSPPSVRISQGDAALLSLTYQIIEPAGCNLASSNGGVFASPDLVLGTVPTGVSIPLNGGIGSGFETVVIPYAVLKRAEEIGAASFTFKRSFTISCPSGPGIETATVNITQTSGIAADFAIKRVQLYFDNRRAETTVKQNTPLRAYADISFSGSGLLRGYWEVDDRAYPPIIEHLSGRETATVSFPEVPPLPTFTPGSHIIRFIITSPIQSLGIPEIIYYVTSDEASRVMTITPAIPAKTLEGKKASTLAWSPLAAGSFYFVEMFEEKNKEEPVFSAYTKDPLYQLPDFALRHVFKQEGLYQWRIKGFDAEGKLIGESAITPLSLSF